MALHNHTKKELEDGFTRPKPKKTRPPRTMGERGINPGSPEDMLRRIFPDDDKKRRRR